MHGALPERQCVYVARGDRDNAAHFTFTPMTWAASLPLLFSPTSQISPLRPRRRLLPTMWPRQWRSPALPKRQSAWARRCRLLEAPPVSAQRHDRDYAWSVTKNGNAYTPLALRDQCTSFGFTPDGEARTSSPSRRRTITARWHFQHGRYHRAARRTSCEHQRHTGTINEGDPVSLTATATDQARATPTPMPGPSRATTPLIPFQRCGDQCRNVELHGRTNRHLRGHRYRTDMDNEQTIASSSSIVAADVPPTVAISGEPSGSIPENTTPVTLTAAPTEPGSGQTYSYAWSMTKNGVAYTLPSNVATMPRRLPSLPAAPAATSRHAM